MGVLDKHDRLDVGKGFLIVIAVEMQSGMKENWPVAG